MIQRIQSVYLFVSVLVIGVFTFINEHAILLLANLGFEGVSPSLVGILVALIAFTVIFLFKNRALQIKLIWLAILASLIASVLYAYVDGFKVFFMDWEFYLIPLTLIFLWLAKSGVQKDESLVRSSDRLR